MMKKIMQQTALAISLLAGVSLAAHALPLMETIDQHGPGFGPGQDGPGGPGGPGFGPGMPGPGPEHGPHGLPDMMPQLAPPPFLFGLDLTEAQQDKVFSILLANAPLVHEQEKLGHKSGQELHTLLEQDQYDEAKIKSAAEAEARAKAQLLVLHARTMHQILAVLTPEQHAKLQAMKDKFKEHRHADEHDNGHDGGRDAHHEGGHGGDQPWQ